MRCLKQPKFLENTPAVITNVWEVRIAPDLWKEIVKYAKFYNLSYSWVVRYCVFRLARKPTLRMRPAMENLSREITANQPPSGQCQRHMLCLYGQDEQLLRLAAMKMGVTVSQLIRIALGMYLRLFEFDIRFKALHKNHGQLQEYYAIRRRIKNEKKLKKALQKFFKGNLGCQIPRTINLVNVFWYGIKLTKTIHNQMQLEVKLPLQMNLYCLRFTKKDWFAIRYPQPCREYPMAA